MFCVVIFNKDILLITTRVKVYILLIFIFFEVYYTNGLHIGNHRYLHKQL